MDYKIKFLKNVTEKDLPSLPIKIELRVNKAIQERLTVDPVNLGEPLYHSFKVTLPRKSRQKVKTFLK
ncbi:hypothetical protein [Wolbachia endosymbiont (group B) of Villa cingulata]|uniref:hypothetical protein n=1 Tax=Wolbachia endosymbiont (group B) of Villa cingulata TaxID=3066157 RepID=UPI00333E71F6